MPKNNGKILKKTQKDATNKYKKKIEDNLKNITSKRLSVRMHSCLT